MQLKRKFFVISALAAIVTFGVAATSPDADEPQYKNLKILPKNITHEELDKVMHVFNKGLGVKCNFCHAPAKDNERKLDFASDEKPEKDIARSMMKLTVKINNKYFGAKRAVITDSTLAITCVTCHHGEPHPWWKIIPDINFTALFEWNSTKIPENPLEIFREHIAIRTLIENWL